MTQEPITTPTTSNRCELRAVDNAAYHSDKDILSSSMLKHALESPAQFIASLTTPSNRTDAKDFGTLIHALILEPHTVQSLVAISAQPLGRDADSKKFRKANADRICLSIAEFASATQLADKVLSTMFRGRPFYKFVEEGTVESSIYYTDPTTGIECRTRLDLMHPDFTFDIKTTRQSTAPAFQRDAISMHYDLSAYMYSLSRVLLEKNPTPKPFVLVPVCTDAPHSVFFMPCSSSVLENGQRKYNTALSTIQACTRVNHWPGLDGEYEMDIEPWQAFTPEPAPWRKTALT